MTCETVGTRPPPVPMAYRLGWLVRRTAAHTLNRLAVHL
ncbi:MAG: hypothetical protein JWN54_2116 [Mycobacterium sp.]|jgi:hypothetical protein|nr:hypothetical protein [Mycobacterium sp.]